jgi:hypothetical protein
MLDAGVHAPMADVVPTIILKVEFSMRFEATVRWHRFFSRVGKIREGRKR